jgi:hypothetical protein
VSINMGGGSRDNKCFRSLTFSSADIFRPFVGFREVRLVNKESRHPGGDPHVLCFVDFDSPAQATIALEALQGEQLCICIHYLTLIFDNVQLRIFFCFHMVCTHLYFLICFL